MVDIITVMPWVKTKCESYAESIKWNQGNSRYEIHSRILEDMDLDVLVPHCLEVRRKIQAVVNVDNHLGPAFFRVFPRTLSTVLQSIWDVIVEADNPAEDEEGFNATLSTFIASNCTAEDRHELAQQLRHPQKPRELSVQTFYYRMLELNSYMAWMPGTDDELTDDQIRQSFYDGMPNSWRDKFINAGKVVSDLTVAEHTRYFRQQEKLAMRKQHDNSVAQRRETSTRRRNAHGAPVTPKKGPTPRSKYERDKNKSDKKPFKRIAADDPCPLHGGAHKWGECVANAYNPKREETLKSLKAKRESNTKKKTVEHFAMEVDESDDDITYNSSISNASSKMENDDDNGAMYNMEAIIPRRKRNKKNSRKTKSKCFRKDFEQYPYTDIFSHHIDIIHPTYTQSELNVSGLADTYMSYINECYHTGTEDTTSTDIYNNETVKPLNLKPIGLLTIAKIQNFQNNKPLRVLFDTGSDKTFINRSALPVGANSETTAKTVRVNTINGINPMNQIVSLKLLGLPEFSPTQKADGENYKAYVFNKSSPYDIILGLDIMVPLGIDVSCTTQTVTWNGTKVPWKPRTYFQDSLLQDASAAEAHCLFLPSSFDNDMEQLLDDCFFAMPIKESLYETVSTQDVLDKQSHLTTSQIADLSKVLNNYQRLFNGDLVTTGKLGKFNGPKVHLELIPGSIPVRQRPYPVPQSQIKVFKTELQRLISIGVLETTGPSEWLTPTFIIPKKDGRVRWISDFRALNKCLKRKVYQLPKIQDILKKRNGYKYFTKIDISMQYYAFELDEPSKELCSICTPFGNYRYCRCAMGVKQSPDIAQHAMENLFQRVSHYIIWLFRTTRSYRS